MEEKRSEQELIRREKAENLKALGIDPFGHSVKCSHNSVKVKEDFKNYTKEELHEMENPPVVSLAGRLMTIRCKGKVSFAHIQDQYGQIQIYLRKDNMNEEEYDLFLKEDIGDIIYVEGNPMITNTGEFTIRVLKFEHLVKALRPLPEKFHGLTDIEEIYRRRYVDLIMNEESKNKLLLRSKMLFEIRKYLNDLGYIEVETPILTPILGGANAKPFITHYNALNVPYYLRIATELYLKRCLVGGIEGVYEMGRIFRNEGMDTTHNPEFTSIEIYKAYSDLSGMMELNENMIKYLADTLLGTRVINYQGTEINLDHFESKSMCEAIMDETGIDFTKDLSYAEALELAKEHHLEVEAHHTGVGHIINLFFEKYCEDKLIQPTFIHSMPIEISPLAKKGKDPRFTERFELYINGHEYANAFTELNDPIDQKERFIKQLEEKNLGNDEASEMDIDFVEALEYGMPPAGGIGIGIDRLAMLFTDSVSIRDVLMFPQMKPRRNN